MTLPFGIDFIYYLYPYALLKWLIVQLSPLHYGPAYVWIRKNGLFHQNFRHIVLFSGNRPLKHIPINFWHNSTPF
jgi:hypothetical protein